MEKATEKNNSLKKEFESLLAKDLGNRHFKEGSILTGVVEEISKKFVYIDLGLKSSSAIPIEEFKLSNEIAEIKVGSKIKILLERLEHPKTGGLIASREKARKAVAWQKMEKAFENSEKITAKIVSKIKGGFAVDCQSCLCFLPNSQLSLKPLSNEEIKDLMKEPQVFEIVKMDKRRGNIVLSRRQHLQRSVDASREEEISKLKVGMIVEDAVVKALTPWGAFIMVNNIETLCHINEISHSRISAPSDLLKVSQKLRVKIIKIDNETKKVSTSIKALTENPFNNAIKEYKIGSEVDYDGVVTSVQDYGVFVKLDKTGIEGLVHVSEIDWTNNNPNPHKIAKIGDEVEVMILDIDSEKRRVSLGIKQCLKNPWEDFSKNFSINEKIKGTIKSITDFGIFIGLDGNIDGLIHISDISWDSEDNINLGDYKKGTEIETVILSIDPQRQRISLGIKQLQDDPFANFMAENKRGKLVNGVTGEIDESNALVLIAENIRGLLNIFTLGGSSLEYGTIKSGLCQRKRLLGGMA